MTRGQALILLAFIVLFGFCARASTFKSPLLDHHAWRQADTAAIARNFFRERFDVRYPQVDWRGAQPVGYVETGLEASAFLVAALSKAAGSFHPEVGRVVSALTFIPSCLFAWSFVRRRYGQPHGTVAAFVYAFGLPLLLYIERAFMNEALLILLTLSCLVATQRYLEHGKIGWWLIVCAASALLGAIKLPYLIVLAPIAGLFMEARGWRAVTSWELWLAAAVDAGAAAAWYTHARQLADTTGLSFGFQSKVLDWDLAFSGAFASKIWSRLVRDLLGPIGVLALIAGLGLAVARRRWCELMGVAAFVLYVLVVSAGNFAHDYYQLPLMPVAVPLIASALGELHTRLAGSARFAPRADGVLAGLLLLAALSTFVRLSSFHSWFYYAPPDIDFCASAAALDPREGRAVFVAEYADPKFLFCSNRKGWVLSEGEHTSQAVRTAWAEGAALLFLSEASSLPDVEAFAREHGDEVDLGGPFRVFRLRKSPG
jgi:hypothetical protein